MQIYVKTSILTDMRTQGNLILYRAELFLLRIVSQVMGNLMVDSFCVSPREKS